MNPEQYHRYMQYVFDTQFNTPEEKKMKKSIIKKINKAQKKKGLPVFKEGSCGYGIDGEVGDEPAGPHLLKKKKTAQDDSDVTSKNKKKITMPKKASIFVKSKKTKEQHFKELEDYELQMQSFNKKKG